MDIDDAIARSVEIGCKAAANGQVAQYIPQLRELDPHSFGLAVIELDGTEHVMGDVDIPFPIQSMSKVFSLTLAMQKLGGSREVGDAMWRRVGREPSGDPFNSLVQLEHECGIPRNPMINAGALVIDDLLLEYCADPKNQLLALVRDISGDGGERIWMDPAIAAAEDDASMRNRAMGNLMAAFDNLHHPLGEVLDVYNNQCSLMMTARQIARAMRFLANDGIDPASRRQILSSSLAKRVMAIMLTCGTYDAAGEFAFSVGLPCKSGVAGGIMAAAPDHSGICVWSPPLDVIGNSLGGRIALHELTNQLELSIF
ncbi:MAG: glutaminase [Wenzhouxiangellaceae bacterium]|nr:glutaminase [Wenzhouxiangellaceae bacterium]